MDDPPTPPPTTRHPERHPDDLPPPVGARARVPRGLLWAAALFVVVLTIAGWMQLSNDQAGVPTDGGVAHLDNNAPAPTVGGLTGINPVGRPAPASSFETFTGNKATLTDFRGKPVLVNFWASSCTPCVTEMPDLEKVHQEYGDRVQFVGLDTQDGENPARRMAEQTGVTYLLGFDRTAEIAAAFGATNLPTTVLIDRHGTVVYSRPGAKTADEIRRLISENLQP
jgi:thiol-disulfide isomerase/thioredoxin